MRTFLSLVVFAIGAPLIISLSALYLFTVTPRQDSPAFPPLPPQVLSAQTSSDQQILYPMLLGTYGVVDARVHIIKNYLRKYSSPLFPFSQDIVDISDKYSLDYRLLVAIARQESNLCKRIPEGSHNCWGFGIYGDLVTRFDSYPQALEKVAKTLKRDYLDKGLTTPLEIMAKYTPPSLEKGGPWAKAVNQFMADLE